MLGGARPPALPLRQGIRAKLLMLISPIAPAYPQLQVLTIFPRPGWTCAWWDASNNNPWGCGTIFRCSEFGGWRELETWKRQGAGSQYFTPCALPRHFGAEHPRWTDGCVCAQHGRVGLIAPCS